jgi:hypothetical protein
VSFQKLILHPARLRAGYISELPALAKRVSPARCA